jgi:hypothetical protein
MALPENSLPSEKDLAFLHLQKVVSDHLPDGFTYGELYKMPSWFISLQDYPPGYHCKKNEPLPFLSVASQKSHIAIYHMGLYADEKLYNWFTENYEKQTGKKPDIGKSCIRFKKPSDIPFEFIAELVSKLKPADWIALYESKYAPDRPSSKN